MKLRALITRPEEDAVPLAHALSQSGIAVAVEPLLTIRPVSDASIDLDGVQAVLFTSANGARVFAQLAGERNLPGWKNLPAFTVGVASAATAEAAGFARVESAGGDVAALAQLVATRLDPKAGALFHGAGSAVAGDLAGSLAAAGFEVRRSMIYEARPADRLSDGTSTALSERSIDLVLLFSPRTAATFQSLVRAAGDGAVAGCGHAAALCLSPAVAGAVGDLPWRSVKTADRPDMPAMLELVAQYLEEMGEAKNDAPTPPAEATMTQTKATTMTSEASISPAAMPPPRRSGGLVTILIAAATAALVAGAIGMYWSKTLSGPGNAGPQVSSIDPDLLAKIDDAGTRATAAAGSAADVGNRLDALTSAFDTMRGDLAQLQAAGGTMDGALPAELASLKNQLTEIGQQLATLKERMVAFEQQLAELKATQSTVTQGASVDGAALEQLSGENETLRSEIANLKSQLEPLNGLASRVDALDLAVKEQSTGSTNSALALAAGQLNATLATARSFTAELNALSDVTAVDPGIASEVDRITAPVRDFADAGIPTLPDLRSQFPAVASAVAQLGTKDALTGLTGATNDGGWFERVLDRLSSVVVVRPVGDVSGDTPAARVARAESLLQAGDLGGAVDELAALSGAPAAVAEWLGHARARLAADQAITALQTATIARLRPTEAAPSGTGG